MTGGGQPVSLDDLQAYVDGELDPKRREAVERHLAEHPDDSARVAAYRSQDQALRQALAGIEAEPVPERLTAVLQDRGRGISGSWMRRAAAVVLLLAGGALGFGFGTLIQSDDAAGRFLADAAIAHDVFIAETRHPIEVAASEREHLQAWLSKRLGAALAAPDLSKTGLSLLGGRLLPAASGPAAQLMYETPDGQRITCYIVAEAGLLAPGQVYIEKGDTAVLAWPTQNFAYAISGPPGRERLSEIAGAVSQELSRASSDW